MDERDRMFNELDDEMRDCLVLLEEINPLDRSILDFPRYKEARNRILRASAMLEEVNQRYPSPEHYKAISELLKHLLKLLP